MCLHGRRAGGLGVGDRGRGGGTPPEAEAAATPHNKTLIRGAVTPGKIVGKRLVQGLPSEGDALVEYSAIHQAEAAGATEALSRDRIPARYRNLVREYFQAIAPAKPDGPSDKK